MARLSDRRNVPEESSDCYSRILLGRSRGGGFAAQEVDPTRIAILRLIHRLERQQGFHGGDDQDRVAGLQQDLRVGVDVNAVASPAA